MAGALIRLAAFFNLLDADRAAVRLSFRVRLPRISHEAKPVIEKPEWEDLPIDITTLINEAIREGKPECIRLENGSTLLHYVIGAVKDEKQRYDLCKLLLDNGADPNIRNRNLDTPFHYALELRDEELLKLLMSKGASVKRRNGQLQKPLTQAVYACNPLAVKYLLSHGADPNRCEWFAKRFLLAECVLSRQETIARLLLFYGANPNDGDAILMASLASNVKMIQLLIDNGTDLTRFGFGLLDDRNKNCPIGVLILFRKMESLEILLENGMEMDMDKYCILTVAYTFYEIFKHIEDEVYLEFEKMMEAIIKHVVVLMVTGQGMLIKNTTSQIISKKRLLKNTFDAKLEQIISMSETRVREDFKVTYLDLMTRKGQKFVSSCNEDVLETFAESEPEKLFPYFADKLKRNVSRGRNFKNALERFKQQLYEILDYRLPFDLICCICDFLDASDLKRFTLFELIEDEMKIANAVDEKDSLEDSTWQEQPMDKLIVTAYGYSPLLCKKILHNDTLFE